MWTPREDIGQAAFSNMGNLVEALRNSTTMSLQNLSRNLLMAHNSNWAAFAGIVSVETQQAKLRDTIIADATARLRLDDSAPASPCLMAPVSPAYSLALFSAAETPDDSDTDTYAPQPQRKTLRARQPHIASSSVAGPDVLFTQGYRYIRRQHGHRSGGLGVVDRALKRPKAELDTSQDSFKGTCTLCTRSDQVMALVLKKPDDDEQTPNYPEPQQSAKHK